MADCRAIMSRGPAGLPLEEAEAEIHAKGTVHVWMKRPLLVVRATGTLTVVAARAMANAAHRLVEPGGRYMSFHDWEDLTDYESEARRILTEASARHRANMERTHILLRSRLLVAALDAGRVFLKHIVAYSSRDAFEAELRMALQNKLGAPTRPPPPR